MAKTVKTVKIQDGCQWHLKFFKNNSSTEAKTSIIGKF